MTLAKHWKYGQHEDLVLSNLKGLCHSNPTLGLIESDKVVVNSYSDTDSKICLISGGGAGHEPLHGGYVGSNLLDAAVSGAPFASPSTKQIMAAVRAKSNKERGTLVIVKNYTGDVLHFGLAVEKAKSEGYKIDILAVADDVAVGRKQNAMVGRRGLAGTALVHKILGGAATIGGDDVDLELISHLGQSLNESLVTLGASLDRTSVPGKNTGDLEFTGPNEAELGLGIHNEPGTKMSPIPNIDDLIKDMYHKLLSPEDEDRHYVNFDLQNDEFVLLVNNIGGTSSLELYALTEHVVSNLPLAKRPKRVLVSDFVTSLNAPGFSITLMNLSQVAKSAKSFSVEQILSYLDLETNAPGWKPQVYASKEWETPKSYIQSPLSKDSSVASDLTIDGAQFGASLESSLHNLIKSEPKITHYDTLVGDGDCGETLVLGANGILEALQSPEFQATINDPVATLAKITDIVEDTMGGTSGGIYSIFLTALVHQLQKLNKIDVPGVAGAFHEALYSGLFKYTKARIGGRTLVDTLQPFVDTLNETNDISKSVEAARKGCEGTKYLEAKFGRASYVDEKEFEVEGGIPDPGAVGLLSIIQGFLNL